MGWLVSVTPQDSVFQDRLPTPAAAGVLCGSLGCAYINKRCMATGADLQRKAGGAGDPTLTPYVPKGLGEVVPQTKHHVLESTVYV